MEKKEVQHTIVPDSEVQLQEAEQEILRKNGPPKKSLEMKIEKLYTFTLNTS